MSKALSAGFLAVLLSFAAPPARAAGTTILILSGGLGAEEDRLVEALRIYTGDVQGRIVLAGKAPTALDARVIDDLSKTARAEDADIVAWGGRRADGRPIFYVLDVGDRDLRETEIEPLGAERAALDVALKVRALLFKRHAEAAPKPAGPPQPPPPPPAPVPLLAPRAPVVAAPLVVVRTVVRAPVEEPVVFHRYAFATAYELIAPSDAAWMRQALLVTLERRMGRAPAPVSIYVDGALATQPVANVRGFTTTLVDWPLGAGVLLTREWGRAALALGPRASLHRFAVRVSDDDGRTGASTNYAVGLGGALRGELGFTSYMKVYLGASVEALVPKQEFKLGGQPAFDTGWRLLGFSAGLRWLLL